MRVEGTAEFSGKTPNLELRVVPGTAFDHERLTAVGAAGKSVVIRLARVLMLDTLAVDVVIDSPQSDGPVAKPSAKPTQPAAGAKVTAG